MLNHPPSKFRRGWGKPGRGGGGLADGFLREKGGGSNEGVWIIGKRTWGY